MKIKKLGLLYRGIILLLAGFLLLAVALLGRELVDSGVEEREQVLPLLDEVQWNELVHGPQEDRSADAECLFITDQSESSTAYSEVMLHILDEMRVPCRQVTTDEFKKQDLAGYTSVILCVVNCSSMGEGMWDLMDWVKAGGNMMLLNLPARNGNLDMIAGELGIISTDGEYTIVEGIRCPRPFMIGGDREYSIIDPYDSSVRLLVDDQCEVYLESTGDIQFPLIWRRPLEDGTIVVTNLGFVEKMFKGFYAAAYSLLGDGFAWPVINGSAFFLDDFPAPVPNGVEKYIQRDYNIGVAEFYQQIWWPDVQDLGEKYGLRYTGSVIEDYSNATEAPFVENLSTNQFRYFGFDILQMGGEIGLHGYDHMPLVLDNFTYQEGNEDLYTPWASMEDMEASLTELIRFCSELYPNDTLQIYVPPSNTLSDEARAMIAERFPQIRVIASVFMPDDEYIAYDQDFGVADDGIVELPRIISGYQMNDFIYISAFSELNFHYVNTHFQHPDDVLDEDRGAELGWEALKGQLDEYMNWLYTAAPDIRNMTASELAAAVQRYDAVTVRRTLEEDQMVLELGNFVDEAWLMVRLNGREPGEVEGGTLEKQLDGLYLLKAESDRVTIELD